MPAKPQAANAGNDSETSNGGNVDLASVFASVQVGSDLDVLA